MSAEAAVATVAAIILALGLARELFRIWRDRQLQAAYLESDMRDIDQMAGVAFEHYIAVKLRNAGLAVEMTKTTGDFGVDLIAILKTGKRIAIQCKRHSKPVGVAAIQQVVAGARMYGCGRTWVISNQDFTPAATKLAAAHSCSLIGRRELYASFYACEYCGFTADDVVDINRHEVAHRRQ